MNDERDPAEIVEEGVVHDGPSEGNPPTQGTAAELTAEETGVAGESSAPAAKPEADEALVPSDPTDDTIVEKDTTDPADGETDDAESEPPAAKIPTGPVELNLEAEEVIKHEWYILKVQSNREKSISDALRRKVAIEGLEDYFADIKIPTEKVIEFKGGKKKSVERKIWPGYIAIHMHVNDNTWFAIRETSGIGDFTGSGGKPTPMPPEDVKKMMPPEDDQAEDAPKLDIKFKLNDKVKVMEGNFENFEGEVSGIDEAHGRVTVMLSIFGRPTPVELEYWQVEVV